MADLESSVHAQVSRMGTHHQGAEMITNQARAAEVVGEAYQQAMESSVPSAWRGIIAQALADDQLAALAPEAVAEVVRLRRELEELREVFVRAAEMMGKFEIPADRQQAQGFAGRITRILEGTHE